MKSLLRRSSRLPLSFNPRLFRISSKPFSTGPKSNMSTSADNKQPSSSDSSTQLMNQPNEGSLFNLNPVSFDPFSRPSSLLGSSLWNDPFFPRMGDLYPLIGRPLTQWSETETAYELNADLPGVRKEDIQVNVDGRKFTITAKSQKKEDDAFGRRRWHGEYVRSMILPEDAEMDKINAKYENGQLKVCIEKQMQAKTSTARRIEVK